MNKSKVVDMTSGTPIRHILVFTIPLLIGNIFQQLYNMVDSIVVGKYVGKDALAAVGACGSMNFLFFALSSGLSIGIGVIVSQYFGAKDDKNVRLTIANSVYVLCASSLIVSLLAIALAKYILILLGTPESILADSVLYARTTCAGILAIAIYNGVASILRALGDSRTPLCFLILSSIVNVSLDLFFVILLHMGILGVALATVVAQIISAVTCVIYALKKVDYFRLSKEEMKPNKLLIVRCFKLGVPLSLQSSMIAISCMALQGVVNTYGEDVIAANTITSRVEMIVQMGFSSIASALTVFSGQNIGAAKVERVKKGFWQSVVVAVIFSIILIPFMYILGSKITSIFVSEQSVVDIGYGALKFTSLFYIFLGMIYMPRALLNGCGDTAFSMINGVTEVICRVLFSQLFMHLAFLGYWAVWGTTVATWFFTSIVCMYRYFRGKWISKSLVAADESLGEPKENRKKEKGLLGRIRLSAGRAG
ncbi:MATE family efflux transporter [Eubacterium xylanophilum]|uniref:MATE family efflux transporter n=1 Tax=Eubacterium xylanophilum TaxID=39497 RepID=UPI0004AD5F55|nr:MATE family efflux transporter [Eubacterium xylanophilum]